MNKTFLTILTYLLLVNVEVYADTLTVASMTSSQGFQILGENSAQLGYKISPCGDFNNDGNDDFFVSSRSTANAYILFGGSSATTGSTFTVSGSMSSSQGFKIIGPANSNFGTSFASGDFNEDGFSDIMIGAMGTNQVFVLFGGSTSSLATTFGSSFTVGSSMTSTQGFQINGPANSQFGISLASADFNGDSRADVIIGANSVAQAYVIFGCTSFLLASRYGSSFTVTSSMTSYQGIQFNGPSNFGLDVSAGDLDGDNLAEIIVGGFTTNVFVLMGASVATLANSSPYGASFTVGSSMTSAQGFVVNPNESSFFGSNVAAVGDFNQDGFGDFMIGNPAQATGNTVNKAYLLFGGANLRTKFGAAFAVTSTMTSAQGFQLSGSTGFGNYVSLVGDVNNDGYADLLISGTSVAYVILGCASTTISSRFGSSFAVSSSITAQQGYVLQLPTNVDFNAKMSRKGDINKDGYSDIFIGAFPSNKAYVILGYCAAGTYQSSGICTACPASSYCPGGASKANCPAGTASAASSSSLNDCLCNAGSYSLSLGASCAACPANFYCTGGTAKVSCQSGYTSNAGSSASNACQVSTVTTPPSQTQCASGTYSTSIGGTCLPCPANSYCTGGTSLTSCPTSTSSPVGSASGAQCTGGSAASGSTSVGLTFTSLLISAILLVVTIFGC